MPTRRSLPSIVIALVVAATIAYAPLVLGGQTWDDVAYHVDVAPPRLATADSVQLGALPAWWDGTGLGVPLLAEPSHGAMYPLLWFASTPRLLDLLMVLHLVWAALGVAVWARTRVPPSVAPTSDASALVAGLLVVTTGLLASTALRGALPALAHLPWIGAAATWLVAATVRARGEPAHGSSTPSEAAPAHGRGEPLRAAAALGALIGLVGLAGELAVLVDAVVLALVLAGRRGAWRLAALGVLAGLAIASAQWIPAALHVAASAGATVHGLPLSRLLELIVPGSFGAAEPSRAVEALAGTRAWAPSLFVGAPLLALAAVRAPARRVLVVLGAYAALALVTGRDGWPAVLGAPELHLAACALVLAPLAGAGLDALAAGRRRPVLALAGAAGCTALALAAMAVLRARTPEAAPAISRALVDGGLGLVCTLVVIVVAWRAAGRPLGRLLPIVLALLVLPGVGAMRSLAPTIARSTVEEPPPWAGATEGVARPLRVYRPAFLHDHVETVADAMATFGGASGWRWDITAARSTARARPREHDRVWLAASREGGALLDRFGIALAILPETLIVPRKLTVLGRRGAWALVALPVAPLASVLRGWKRATSLDDQLDLLFAPGGGTGVPRGTVVLEGAGDARGDQGPPVPCAIEHWRPGDIAVSCTTAQDGYAAISSTAAPGWSVTVDGEPRPWHVADVLRRAVQVDAGTHHIRWTYAPPGLVAGLVLAALGALALVAALVLARARSHVEP